MIQPCPTTGDADADGVTLLAGDCDDSNPNVWTSCSTCSDSDADGYWSECDAYITILGPDCDDEHAKCTASCFEEDLDTDGSANIPTCGQALDCDDSNPLVYSSAVEVLDGLDNDCDGITDGPFIDRDFDGMSELDGDCDDDDPRVWVSCSTCADLDEDGVFSGCDAYFPVNEQDCNDANAMSWATCATCADADEDGYFSRCDAYPSSAEDCDDDDDTIYPGATEICDDADNDCNGLVDEGLSADDDLDGHFTTASCLQPADDCDDEDTDNWSSCSTCSDSDSDGVFVGCDRYSEHTGPDCNDGDADPNDVGVDEDHDGSYAGCTILSLPDRVDCDDTTAVRDPIREELPCDGIDNDCDLSVDENATADCVAIGSTATLETSALDGHVERLEDSGRIVAVSLLGTEPPAVSANAASHVLALQDFIAEHSVALGVASPPELGAPTMRTARADVFDPEGGPGDADEPLEVPPVAVTTVSQLYGGVKLFGEDLHVTSIMDDDDVRRMRFVDGVIHDPTELDIRIGHLNVSPAIDYADALEIARTWCENTLDRSPVGNDELTDPEIPTELVIDLQGARHIYAFLCQPYILLLDPEACDAAIDPVTECVEARNPTEPGVITYDFNKARATFLGLKDVNPWLDFLAPSYPPPVGSRQTHANVPVDAARLGNGCLYRGTYGGHDPFFGGLDSEFPYPRTNDAGGTEIYRWGMGINNCNQVNDAFQKTTSASFINQMVHQQLAVAAEAVATSSALSLWKKYDPRECNRDNIGDCEEVRVNVKYTADEGACRFSLLFVGLGEARPGNYWPPKEDICLNPRHSAYRPYQTALHEYGHYIADVYGLALNIHNFNSCQGHSVSEGVADALVLSIEHYLRGAQRNTASQAQSRYYNGPGVAMNANFTLSGYSTSPFTRGHEAIKAAQIACTSASSGVTYARGMAIGQVMWSFLNNHYCPAGCGIGNSTRILTSVPFIFRLPALLNGYPVGTGNATPEYAMSVMVREAFTNTLLSTPNNFAVNSFLKRMRDFMEVNYKTRVSLAEWNRIAAVFALHALD